MTCDDGDMIRIVTAVTIAALSLVADPTPSQACSRPGDEIDPPDVVLEYDADLSPAAPSVTVSEIYHIDDPSTGCTPGCGQFSMLHLEMEVEGDEGWRYVRVADAVGGTRYAATDLYDGRMRLDLLGYDQVDSSLTVSVTLLDEDGRPSLPVEVTAMVLVEEDSAGCRVSTRGAGWPVLVLLALVVAHRRRQQLTDICRN